MSSYYFTENTKRGTYKVHPCQGRLVKLTKTVAEPSPYLTLNQIAYRNTADSYRLHSRLFQKEMSVSAGVEIYLGKICVYGKHYAAQSLEMRAQTLQPSACRRCVF